MIMDIKILFLLHLPPPVHGSSVVGFSIKGSKIINKKFNCYYINLLASHNVSESGVVNFKKLLSFLCTWLKTFVLLLRIRPHICYIALTTTGTAFYRDVLLIALLKVFRIKRIYHLHNKGISLHQHKIINQLFYRFVFDNSDVILLSELLYPDIQMFVSKSKVHICPNGISREASESKIQNFRKTDKNNTNNQVENSKRPVQILFLSNLFESKGVFILLEACKILMNKEISFECLFIGEEGDISTLQFNEHVKQLDLSKYIYYKGRIFGTKKYLAYSEADIIAFPTYKDCFPLVLLEAMSHSLPVISTFEGGIPDIIENDVNGFLVPQQNSKILADKLELLIKNPELRIQMGEIGCKKYKQKFTSEIFENKLSEILLDVYKK